MCAISVCLAVRSDGLLPPQFGVDGWVLVLMAVVAATLAIPQLAPAAGALSGNKVQFSADNYWVTEGEKAKLELHLRYPHNGETTVQVRTMVINPPHYPQNREYNPADPKCDRNNYGPFPAPYPTQDEEPTLKSALCNPEFDNLGFGPNARAAVADFTALTNHNVTFPAGSQSQIVEIQTTDDNVYEELAEGFVVEVLVNGTVRDTAIVTITDMPRVVLNSSDPNWRRTSEGIYIETNDVNTNGCTDTKADPGIVVKNATYTMQLSRAPGPGKFVEVEVWDSNDAARQMTALNAEYGFPWRTRVHGVGWPPLVMNRINIDNTTYEVLFVGRGVNSATKTAKATALHFTNDNWNQPEEVIIKLLCSHFDGTNTLPVWNFAFRKSMSEWHHRPVDGQWAADDYENYGYTHAGARSMAIVRLRVKDTTAPASIQNQNITGNLSVRAGSRSDTYAGLPRGWWGGGNTRGSVLIPLYLWWKNPDHPAFVNHYASAHANFMGFRVSAWTAGHPKQEKFIPVHHVAGGGTTQPWMAWMQGQGVLFNDNPDQVFGFSVVPVDRRHKEVTQERVTICRTVKDGSWVDWASRPACPPQPASQTNSQPAQQSYPSQQWEQPAPAVAPLGAPEDHTISAVTETSMTVSWREHAGVIGYNVVWAENREGASLKQAYSKGSPYTITGLKPDTEYAVAVMTTSYDGISNSAFHTTSPLGADSDLTVVYKNEIAKFKGWRDGAMRSYVQWYRDRWNRVLLALGVTDFSNSNPSFAEKDKNAASLTPMTAAEAKQIQDAQPFESWGTVQWMNVVAVLTEVEAIPQTTTPAVSITAGSDVTVTVSQSGDFATAGSQTVTIPTTGSATLTVGTTDDSVDEADGSVTATVDAGTGYTVSTTAGSGTVQVADNDVPEISISAGSGVTEGADATFTVTASPAPAADLDVTVTVSQSGDFVTAGSQTVTIPSTGSATLTVGTDDDSTEEADGSVTATVDAGTGYTVSTTQAAATVGVSDNDASSCTLPSDKVTAAEVRGWRDAHSSQTVKTRFNGVLEALGEDTGTSLEAMTADEADDISSWAANSRWDRIARTLAAHEQCGDAPPPDPEVSITAGSGVTEGADATFTVTSSPAPSADLDVTVTVSQSGDFVTAGTQTVTIPSTGSATLTVGTDDDSTDEPHGSVTATLGVGNGYTVSSSADAATVAVSDNDDPQPAECALPSDAVDADEVRGWRDAHSSQTVKTRFNGVLEALGEDTGTSLEAMTADEADDISSWANNTKWDRIARTLAAREQCDDDAPPPPPDPEISIAGGSGVTEGADATFTVTATPAPTADLDVTVTVTASGDYGVTTGSQTVTIPTGGSVTLTVGTTNDSVDETNGSVTVTVNSGNGYTVSSSNAATVAVSDDDVPPPASDPVISISGGSGVTEGDNASFTISASPAPSATLVIRVSVSQSGDFGANTGTRMVAIPTSGSATLIVGTTNDNADEANGSVTVTVSAGNGYTLSSSNAATVAVWDDQVPQVSISGGSAVIEGGNAAFTLTANPAPQTALSVSVNVAQSGDYGVSTGTRTVTIPTSGSGTLTIATSGDTNDEPNGSVTAKINDGSGYAVSSSRSATVTINDDDAPKPPLTGATLSIADASGQEGFWVEFTVTLSEAVSHEVRVNWASADNYAGNSAAIEDIEFWTMSGTLVFAPGETEQSGEVWLNEDSYAEADETFLVKLSDPTGAAIADGVGLMTIIDND